MIDKIQIADLIEHPTKAILVERWIENEWGKLPINDYYLSIYNNINWPYPLPRTLIALYNQEIVGTVSVLLDDLETRPEFNPWIGCLFVLKKYRRKGIGSKLFNEAEKLAINELGIKKAYLFTENQAHLYSHLGWIEKETDYYKGNKITIMEKELMNI